MEHVVFFPAADGTSGFRCVPSLEEAVRLVEHLRNVEGVDGVSVHTLTPVPLQFRAYYRVEVPTGPAASAPVEVPPVALQLPAQASQPEAEQLVPELAPEAVADEPVEVACDDEPVPALALVEDLPAAEPAEPPVALNGSAKDSVPTLGFFA